MACFEKTRIVALSLAVAASSSFACAADSANEDGAEADAAADAKDKRGDSKETTQDGGAEDSKQAADDGGADDPNETGSEADNDPTNGGGRDSGAPDSAPANSDDNATDSEPTAGDSGAERADAATTEVSEAGTTEADSEQQPEDEVPPADASAASPSSGAAPRGTVYASIWSAGAEPEGTVAIDLEDLSLERLSDLSSDSVLLSPNRDLLAIGATVVDVSDGSEVVTLSEPPLFWLNADTLLSAYGRVLDLSNTEIANTRSISTTNDFSVSPDGRYLANYTQSGNWRIQVLDMETLDSGAFTEVATFRADGSATAPAWLDNGLLVWSETTTFDVYVADPNNPEQEPIRYPTWDGEGDGPSIFGFTRLTPNSVAWLNRGTGAGGLSLNGMLHVDSDGNEPFDISWMEEHASDVLHISDMVVSRDQNSVLIYERNSPISQFVISNIEGSNREILTPEYNANLKGYDWSE